MPIDAKAVSANHTDRVPSHLQYLQAFGLETQFTYYLNISMTSNRGFGKSQSPRKASWKLANSGDHSGCVAIDTSGEFDWVSNIMSGKYRDGDVLSILDESKNLQCFSKNDVNRLDHLPPPIVGVLNTSQPNWWDAIHCFVAKGQLDSVISNLRMMVSGGFVVTVIKDIRGNIRLIPSLLRGQGAFLYNKHIA